MFEESLVESTAVLGRRNRWSAAASLGIQAIVAAALLSIPLLRPEALGVGTRQLTFVAPPPKPPQPPTPPPQRVHLDSTASHALTAPSPAPFESAPRTSGWRNTLPSDTPEVPGTTLISMGDSGPALPFSANSTSDSTGPRVVRAPAPASSGPTHVSSGVISGLLLAPIEPVYPPIAKAVHQEGTVVIQAIISKSGHIESAHVVSGPAMLQGAALDAVRAARYRPYLLNNQPTEVDTTISITFRMTS